VKERKGKERRITGGIAGGPHIPSPLSLTLIPSFTCSCSHLYAHSSLCPSLARAAQVREQLDGMSLEQYRAWQREHADLKRRVVDLELELQVRCEARRLNISVCFILLPPPSARLLDAAPRSRRLSRTRDVDSQSRSKPSLAALHSHAPVVARRLRWTSWRSTGGRRRLAWPGTTETTLGARTGQEVGGPRVEEWV
jgi:hypothetical protein